MPSVILYRFDPRFLSCLIPTSCFRAYRVPRLLINTFRLPCCAVPPRCNVSRQNSLLIYAVTFPLMIQHSVHKTWPFLNSVTERFEASGCEQEIYEDNNRMSVPSTLRPVNLSSSIRGEAFVPVIALLAALFKENSRVDLSFSPPK